MPQNFKRAIGVFLGGAKHALHLYTSGSNKIHMHKLFLSGTGMGEKKLIYVTNDDPEPIMCAFKGMNISILRYEAFCDLKLTDEFRVVIDAASITQSNENHLEREANLRGAGSVLCAYNLNRLDPELIEQLVHYHDKQILISDLANPSMEVEHSEMLIKKNLMGITLSMLLDEPMCGRDLIEKIHREFKVLLSPGRVYPLLNILKRDGLLECKYGIKKKVYIPANKEKINEILSEQVQTNEILRRLLARRR